MQPICSPPSRHLMAGRNTITRVHQAATFSVLITSIRLRHLETRPGFPSSGFDVADRIEPQGAARTRLFKPDASRVDGSQPHRLATTRRRRDTGPSYRSTDLASQHPHHHHRATPSTGQPNPGRTRRRTVEQQLRMQITSSRPPAARLFVRRRPRSGARPMGDGAAITGQRHADDVASTPSR